MTYYLSPAKINLYLKIIGKRADGYHLIESVFSLINLFDLIQINPLKKDKIVSRFSTPPPIIKEQDNLITKAAYLLKKKTGCKYGAEIILHKNIPIGAGLGGGSSNAATTLIALNHLWKTNLSSNELKKIGLQLGADVPFFVMGQNSLVTGIGEILEPVQLETAHYVVVFPNIHISTKKIFQSLALTQNESTRIISGLGGKASDNDLQATAFYLYPALETIAYSLEKFGNPVMTGSGSAMFINTKNKEQALLIKNQLSGEDLQVYCVKSLTQHPLNGLKK